MNNNRLFLAGSIALITTITLNAQQAQFDWAKTYETMNGSSRANAMVWSTPGVGHHLVTCGEYTGTLDADLSSGTLPLTSQGGSDIFITRQNATNNAPAWAISIGSNGDDKALVIERTSDYNILVGGSFSGTVDFDPGPGTVNLTSAGGTDGFLMKIDIVNGNLIWVQHVAAGAGNEAVTAVGRNQNDVITVAGNFTNSVDLAPGITTDIFISQGNEDIFTARYSSAGQYMRGARFGGTDNDLLYDAATGPNGNAVICGGFFNSIDLDPGAATQQLNATDTTMFLLSLDTNLAYYNHGFLTTKKPGELMYDEGTYRILVAGSFTDSLNVDMDTLSNYIYSNGGYDIFLLATFEYLNSATNPYVFGGTGDDILTATGSRYNQCVLAGSSTSGVFSLPNASADTLHLPGTGNDAFAFILDHLTGIIQNAGLVPSGIALRQSKAATTWFSATGYNIWVAGVVNGSCDYDPTSGTAMLNTTSLIEDGFTFSWAPCSTISVQTGINVCDTIYYHNNVAHPVPSTFYDTLTSSCGSDSIVRWDLYLILPPDTGITLNNGVFTAQQNNASYQWVDCNAGYTPVSGATSQSFTPVQNGSYAVIINYGNCTTDTSACMAINDVGISENSLRNAMVTPNPFDDIINVMNVPVGTRVTISNILGETVHESIVRASNSVINTDHLAQGTYSVVIRNNSDFMTTILIK